MPSLPRNAVVSLGRLLLAVAIVIAAACDGHAETRPPAPTFAGSAACGSCHQGEMAAWRGSHHDLAMAEATDKTVLGNFDGVTFTYAGVTSRFFRHDGRFFVNTDGADGELADFEIRYVFGVTPLQQYLIAFPDGRMQALGIAWDSRPKADGGQRWFHLYPGQNVHAGDPLHWTGLDQTWNFQCAECHSTDLRKNYDATKNTYATTWAEIDVACEACHGPGSAHAAWARGDQRGPDGLTVHFDERKGVHWTLVRDLTEASRFSSLRGAERPSDLIRGSNPEPPPEGLRSGRVDWIAASLRSSRRRWGSAAHGTLCAANWTLA